MSMWGAVLIDIFGQDFDGDELIKLIKKLIEVDQQMIPPPPYALYIRPTMYVLLSSPFPLLLPFLFNAPR